MIRRPPRSTRKESSAASDVYKRQRMDSTILPFFPEELSVRKRLVYWKWSPNGFATDILSSSVDGVLLLLMEAYGFFKPKRSLHLPSSISAYACGLRGPFRNQHTCGRCGNPTAFTGFVDTLQSKLLSVLRTCPSAPYAGVARPLSYDDYKELALKSNCSSVGCAECPFMDAFAVRL